MTYKTYREALDLLIVIIMILTSVIMFDLYRIGDTTPAVFAGLSALALARALRC